PVSRTIKEDRSTQKLHVAKTPCPGTFFESEALGPGTPGRRIESPAIEGSRARRAGVQINSKSGAFLPKK
ncbi:MAG: hypothetical protein IJY35_11625, partial [Clostridia bacterium]|nr:hypothetical protein [Clostridia bacterium]